MSPSSPAFAIVKRFVAVPVGVAMPSELSPMRRLDWTNAQDVYWQWRLANGAPADHAHRPLPPESFADLRRALLHARLHRRRAGGGGAGGQMAGDGDATARLALECDPTAMHFHERAHECEAQARATAIAGFE